MNRAWPCRIRQNADAISNLNAQEQNARNALPALTGIGIPAPLRAVLIPPGITNYTVPIPLGQMQDSLLKNGFSPPADLTIIATAEGVSKSVLLRIVPA